MRSFLKATLCCLMVLVTMFKGSSGMGAPTGSYIQQWIQANPSNQVTQPSKLPSSQICNQHKPNGPKTPPVNIKLNSQKMNKNLMKVNQESATAMTKPVTKSEETCLQGTEEYKTKTQNVLETMKSLNLEVFIEDLKDELNKRDTWNEDMIVPKKEELSNKIDQKQKKMYEVMGKVIKIAEDITHDELNVEEKMKIRSATEELNVFNKKLDMMKIQIKQLGDKKINIDKSSESSSSVEKHSE